MCGSVLQRWHSGDVLLLLYGLSTILVNLGSPALESSILVSF